MSETELAQRKCKPCEGGTPAMNERQIAESIKQLPGWVYAEGALTKTFTFKKLFIEVPGERFFCAYNL